MQASVSLCYNAWIKKKASKLHSNIAECKNFSLNDTLEMLLKYMNYMQSNT